MSFTNALCTVVSVVSFTLLSHPASAQPRGGLELVDDFEDGDTVGWTLWDRVGGRPWGPPIVNATSGELRLATTRVAPEGGGDLALTWDRSSNPRYSEGYFRAKVRADTPGTAVALWLRGSGGLTSNYQFFANLEFGFGIERFGPPYRFMGFLPGASFGLGEEWYMECGTVGDTISLKVWRAGDEEPAEPQLVVPDSTLRVGRFSLYTFAFRSTRVDASFDDVQFRSAGDAIDDCNENGIDDAVDLAEGTSVDCNGNGVPDRCDLDEGSASDVNGNSMIDDCEPRFRRGDCNDDGTVDLSDAVFSLGTLFLGEGDPGCDDACDTNDDGTVDISDAIATLGVLFLGQGTIPPPGMIACGVDPTVEQPRELGCEEYESCPEG